MVLIGKGLNADYANDASLFAPSLPSGDSLFCCGVSSPPIERLTWSQLKWQSISYLFLGLTAWLITAGAGQAGPLYFSFILPDYEPVNLQHVMYLTMVRLMSLFSDCPGAPGVLAHTDSIGLACSL